MHNRELAADHVRRARSRLRALDVLFEAESWADVVRESQEALELALKGLLLAFGVDPPRVARRLGHLDRRARQAA